MRGTSATGSVCAPCPVRNRDGAEGELVLGLGGSALQVELGEQLGQPAVEEDARRQPGRVVDRPAPPAEQPLAQPDRASLPTRPRSESTRNETKKPLTLMNEPRLWKLKSWANALLGPAPRSWRSPRAPRGSCAVIGA